MGPLGILGWAVTFGFVFIFLHKNVFKMGPLPKLSKGQWSIMLDVCNHFNHLFKIIRIILVCYSLKETSLFDNDGYKFKFA